jgi:two-component system, cell cycle sensor histidine kinase and response regulator CckA
VGKKVARSKTDHTIDAPTLPFQCAFEHAAIGMAIIEPAGRLASVNKRLCALLGYDECDLAGLTLQSVSHPEDLSSVVSLLERARAAASRAAAELRVRHRQGHPIWVALAATAMRDDAGPTRYLLAQFTDITERKSAEAAFREGETRYQQDARNAPGMVYQFIYRADGSKIFSFVGESARALLGVEPAAILRDTAALFGLIHPDDRAEFSASAEASRIALAPWSWEGRVVLATGEERRIQAASRLDPQPDGSIVCDGILMDVTERHQAAAQLEESEQRYRSLFDHHPDAVFSLGPNGEFLSANAMCGVISGFPPGALIGRSFAPLIVPEILDVVLERFRAAVGGTPQSYQAAIINSRGHRVDIDVANIPILVGGKVVGVFGVAKDLTARNTLEAQLRQSQKMETVGQLAGGVAHDFNNILASISGFAELLRDDLEPGDPRRVDAEEIVKGTRRGAELTKQLLAFSRKQVLQPVTVDLNLVVEETATMLRPLLGAALHLVTLPAPTQAPVFADRTQLEQVLVNLALNARDAMPEGGTLTIEVGVRPAEGARPALATIEVTDTGTGMAPDVESRAFEPFFTTKPMGQGTGLGLATVHGIVQQSGGTVQLRTAPGAGTTFAVSLPLAAPMPAIAEPPADSAPPAVAGTVLLVEDEEAVRTIAQRILQRAGYQVLTARHGADALRALAEAPTRVDVLLSDVAMPEMGGVELAALAAAQSPGIGVVLMSGYANAAVGTIGKGEVVHRFLAKPFTAPALLSALREAMDDAA